MLGFCWIYVLVIVVLVLLQDFDIPTEQVPRNLPKDEDPSLVKRNKRMLGQLLGTLEVMLCIKMSFLFFLYYFYYFWFLSSLLLYGS